MSSFRRYGGINFSANNNITRSYISNSEQLNINNYSGQQNSKEIFASHIDMSGNSILHTGSIFFQDGTSMNTAGNIGGQGSQGSQGFQGFQGSTGSTGSQGSTGSDYWTLGSSDSIYYNNGNVGIGITGPNEKLDVNGNIKSSGTITSGSDYRIKHYVKPLNLHEYSIDHLNPVYFRFKDSGKESIGVIAHELQEYYPFLVEGEKDGEKTQTVNYNGLIGVLIKEIQVLKKRVFILENKIE